MRNTSKFICGFFMRIIANRDRTAVINQQTGDTGLISGRKTFQGIFGELAEEL